MDELKDLSVLASEAAQKMALYKGDDFELPESFKIQVNEINNSTIAYNRYSAIIETRGNQQGGLKIFMPNQWFYIASFFTDFYKELVKYKKYALSALSKERLKSLGQSKSDELTDHEEAKIDNLPITEQSKNFLRKFITDYSWWGGAKTIDRGDFYVSPILSYAKLVNASQSYIGDLVAFFADKDNVSTLLTQELEKHGFMSRGFSNIIQKPVQIIYYGTPGSGKSYKVKSLYDKKYSKEQVIRTTFHPDTDYATFVGGYKPVTIKDENNREKIVYQFVPQCFTNAYVKAWNDLENPYFLIIEEINRGNCAQIFGDIFQLLDRDDNGYSEYPIDADSDLRKYLEYGKDGNGNSVLLNDQVIAEGKLCLPPNFNIIATMNTSDQSLFPMDTAFKRRWAWEYVPIEYQNERSSQFTLTIGQETFNWSQFLEKINERIKNLTSSEDKQMGNFFIKHSVDEKEFINKVMFYLWSEVGKDNYQTGDRLFVCYNDDKSSKKDFSFNELYEKDATKKLSDFMHIIIDDKTEE